jgi:signal peptidase I
MVDNILIVVSIASIVIWFVQESVARKQQQNNLDRVISGNSQLDAELLQSSTMPSWNEWLYRFVCLMWLAWVASVLMLKDGDFAFVLVILTLLAGFISGLDKLFFSAARSAYVNSKSVLEYLGKYTSEQQELLRYYFTKESIVGEYSKSFFPVLAVVLVLRSFIVEPFQIPSGSMIPTLLVGDYILVNKFAYGIRLPVLGTKVFEVGEPERGDVMVFIPPHKDIYFIKRVIGLPGDEISYVNKVLTINGKRADQMLLAELPALNPQYQLKSENLLGTEHLIHNTIGAVSVMDNTNNNGDFTVTVKPGHYWMMGDNRENSSDSRDWGQESEEHIVGKAFAIWLHWPSVTQLPSLSRMGSIQ